MKKTLSLVLVASLLATPALAAGPEDDPKKKAGLDAQALREAVVAAARAVVAEEVVAVAIHRPQTTPGRAGSGWRTVIGIAMMAGGAAIIAKGASDWEDPDRFDRVKNADAYLAFGVGGGIMTFGFITLKGGLEGRGF